MPGQGNGEPRLSPRRVAAKLKAAKAVELRARDWTWQAIADELGYSTDAAAIKAANRVLANVPAVEDVDEWRKVETVRLELATAAILERVLQGDDQAILSFVRLATRKAKLLGIDAPEQVIIGGGSSPIRVEVTDSLDAESLEMVRALRDRVAERLALPSSDDGEVSDGTE